MKRTIVILLTAIACTCVATAKVQLPQLFQSGMVLQREKPIPVWGTADSNEIITIRWLKKEYTTTADHQGRWRLDLPKTKAGGPYTLEVRGKRNPADTIILTDVLVGDVWLCSGQSNIDVTIERVYPQYPDEIDGFNLPQVRLFRVQNETNAHGPQSDIRPTGINWKPLTKQNACLFSAVGSFLGKRQWEKYKVAQGIIVNSWGGTPIEAWISADSLQHRQPLLVEKTRLYDNPDFIQAQQRANQLADQRWYALLDQRDPGVQQQFAKPDYDDSHWPVIDQEQWLWRGIGTTWYQYPPRCYDIPEGVLFEGDNVITIRFINKYGAAHFIPEKPYLIAFGDDRFSQSPMPADYLKTLMGCWRDTWHDAQLPFCIVQLANYDGRQQTGNSSPLTPQPNPVNSNWALLREAQRTVARDDARAELACIIDLGETVDIHPLRKKEVAERVGLCIDRLVYGKKVLLSPQPVSTTVQGSDVIITFDQPLQTSVIGELEVADATGRYQNADARIDGNKISLKSPVSAPVSIRYAWKDCPRALLRSASGLPVVPFEQKVIAQ